SATPGSGRGPRKTGPGARRHDPTPTAGPGAGPRRHPPGPGDDARRLAARVAAVGRAAAAAELLARRGQVAHLLGPGPAHRPVPARPPRAAPVARPAP